MPVASSCPVPNLSGWPEVSLAEITTKIGSGATPRGGAEAYLQSRVEFALVRSQNVFDRRFDRAGLAFISNEQAHQLRGAALRRGDVLLNITGDGVTFGRACVVPADVQPACVNQHVSIVRVDPEKADSDYVLAFLTHPAVKPYIESFNAGGSRRAITKGHIESFRLPHPPLGVQRAIGAVLRSLDDKIELNRQMNETLEAMARALFKSWFVDFDPVHAKAAGRAPIGMESETAKLFPSEFVDSELGPIPKGWPISRLEETLEWLVQTVNPAHSPALTFEHFSLPAFDRGQVPTHDLGSTILSHKLRISDRSVLLSKLNPAIPRVWLPSPSTANAVCSTEFLVAEPVTGVPRNWLFLTFLSEPVRLPMVAKASGTSNSHQRVRPSDVCDIIIPRPDEALLRRFDSLVAPLLNAVQQNRVSSASLAEVRDLLLPRLLSGEVSAPAALSTAGEGR